MRNYHQGHFKPKNPSKYKGDCTTIQYRSWWEFKVMDRLDKDPNVVWWASEETVIPYRSPFDNKIHRYFVDFTVKVKTSDNKTKVMLIEIKPEYQTKPPEQTPKKKKKTYLNEVVTWGINNAKWEAAKKYCQDNKIEFRILTERHLNLK